MTWAHRMQAVGIEYHQVRRGLWVVNHCLNAVSYTSDGKTARRIAHENTRRLEDNPIVATMSKLEGKP